MRAASRLGRLPVTFLASVAVSLGVTTCDIQTNPAVVRNESDEDGLTWQLLRTADLVNVERPFIEGAAFPNTRHGGCVENNWGWRLVDEDGTVLVERSFEQHPACSGDVMLYEGDGLVRDLD